jgi:CBS domain-containing protein
LTDFSADCTAFETPYLLQSDPAEPHPGGTLYYLVRELTPDPGSWGPRSDGSVRAVYCMAANSRETGALGDSWIMLRGFAGILWTNAMKLERLSVATGTMRKGMTLRDFFEECVRCNVAGLPYVDDQGTVVGRISIRDVYKHMAIPDHLIQVAHVLGDQTDRIDLPEMKVMETMTEPVENYLLENIPSVSPRSSIVKALAIMEMFNTSYIFLIDEQGYRGIVTRMVIAQRMLACVQEKAQETRQGSRGGPESSESTAAVKDDSCFHHNK